MVGLSETLKTHIIENGPMPLDQYMDRCIQYYYANRPSIGADFTTAPEVSQIFGEMVGLWVTLQWHHLGQPDAFILCECGPGRGTLMADILRVLDKTPDCRQAASIHLVETSPTLREEQRKKLNVGVTFHDALNTLPKENPALLLANEFLDALPVRQLIKTESGWAEKMIGVEGNQLTLGLIPCASVPIDAVGTDDTVELSTARLSFAAQVKGLLKRQGGAALLIDYGYHERPLGDTIQALYKGRPCDILDHPGLADLTAHVDFRSLTGFFAPLPCQIATQKAWIQAMGGNERVTSLANANPAQAEPIKQSYNRLIDPQQMGELFKVLEVRSA